MVKVDSNNFHFLWLAENVLNVSQAVQKNVLEEEINLLHERQQIAGYNHVQIKFWRESYRRSGSKRMLRM